MTSDVDLLLIGKTGNGKSATGNSILGSMIFKSMFSMNSVTTDSQFAMCNIQGRVVKVVDGPGLFDTRLDTEQAVQMVNEKLKHAIATNPKGYHAMIVVFKYGCRYTEEEQETIKYLKRLLGDSVIKDYGILVMTCGDVFENEHNKERSYFKNWCSEQKGAFADILNECSGRIVLFNNVARNDTLLKSQLCELIDFVDAIQRQRGPYNDENFEVAQKCLKVIIDTTEKPTVTEEMLQEASLITQSLSDMEVNRQKHNWLQEMKELFERTVNFHKNIVSQDRGTGELKCMIQYTESVKNNISKEIELYAEKQNQLQSLLDEACSDEELRTILETIDWQDLAELYEMVSQEHFSYYVKNVVKFIEFPLTSQWL